MKLEIPTHNMVVASYLNMDVALPEELIDFALVVEKKRRLGKTAQVVELQKDY